MRGRTVGLTAVGLPEGAVHVYTFPFVPRPLAAWLREVTCFIVEAVYKTVAAEAGGRRGGRGSGGAEQGS